MGLSDSVTAAPVQTPGKELEVAHLSRGFLMGSVGRVCLAIWQTKPTPALFEIERLQLEAAVGASPGRALFLCVIEARADPPDQQERDASAKMITAFGRSLAGCACVIEGTGFRSAITRTVLSGIALVVRTPTPYRFFETTSLACTWLDARAGRGTLQGLLDQVELGRARLNQFALR